MAAFVYLGRTGETPGNLGGISLKQHPLPTGTFFIEPDSVNGGCLDSSDEPALCDLETVASWAGLKVLLEGK